MDPRPNRRILMGPKVLWLEAALWLVASLTLGYCAFIWERAHYDQARGNWALDHAAADIPATLRPDPEGALVGRIEVPRLDLSAVVFEGTTEDTLSRGVGHLTGSALPGGAGNLVLAGHRDTFFRPLKNIRVGDTIKVGGPSGEFDYRVDSTEIVNPDATEVLQPGNGEKLTLITCYPFSYIGSAPQRFIVTATRLSP